MIEVSYKTIASNCQSFLSQLVNAYLNFDCQKEMFHIRAAESPNNPLITNNTDSQSWYIRLLGLWSHSSCLSIELLTDDGLTQAGKAQSSVIITKNNSELLPNPNHSDSLSWFIQTLLVCTANLS